MPPSLWRGAQEFFPVLPGAALVFGGSSHLLVFDPVQDWFLLAEYAASAVLCWDFSLPPPSEHAASGRPLVAGLFYIHGPEPVLSADWLLGSLRDLPCLGRKCPAAFGALAALVGTGVRAVHGARRDSVVARPRVPKRT